MVELTPTELKYLAARETLLANLALQERLKDTLKQLGEGIKSNADQQAKIQAAALQMNRSGWYSGLKAVGFPAVGQVGPKAIGPSRFWMTAGRVPEPNEDTKRLFEAFSYLPHSFALQKWNKDEEAELERIVLLAVQDSAHSAFLAELAQARQPITEARLSAKLQKIGAITMQDQGSEEAAMAFDSQWESIAMQLGGVRSAADCRARWVNHLRPSAKLQEGSDTEAWEKEEEQRLCQLADEHDSREWEKIAAQLGNGWSALQCLAKFRQLTAQSASKPWSQEEITQLQISYAQHANKASFWKAVAADLPGRSHNQCMHYWRNQMDRTIKKGKWSPEEDAALKAAVASFGRKWAKVAEAVPTRNQVQVRERWVNVLDPQLKRGKPWTPEEDAVLVAALQECKNADGSIRWAEIARRLPGRTDDVVANHAITLRNFQLKKGAFKERDVKPTAAEAKRATAREKGKKRKRPAEEDKDGSDESSQDEAAEKGASPKAVEPAPTQRRSQRQSAQQVTAKSRRRSQQSADKDPDGVSADDADARAPDTMKAKAAVDNETTEAPKQKRGRPPRKVRRVTGDTPNSTKDSTPPEGNQADPVEKLAAHPEPEARDMANAARSTRGRKQRNIQDENYNKEAAASGSNSPQAVVSPKPTKQKATPGSPQGKLQAKRQQTATKQALASAKKRGSWGVAAENPHELSPTRQTRATTRKSERLSSSNIPEEQETLQTPAKAVASETAVHKGMRSRPHKAGMPVSGSKGGNLSVATRTRARTSGQRHT